MTERDRWWSQTAIAGIGQTKFSKEAGRSATALACEAALAALADAGLDASQVDGLVSYSEDDTDPMRLANALGIDGVTHFARTPYGGGGACAAVIDAAAAVATGRASVVVVWRALTGRSGARYGQAANYLQYPQFALYAPYGLASPAQCAALTAARWMHEHNIANEDFAAISVAARHHAATNPCARFHGKPIEVATHQDSRWIVEPVLRLLDCCLESDGGVALVVTSAERARGLIQPVVTLRGGAQGMTSPMETMKGFYGSDPTGIGEARVAAKKLWKVSGLNPGDIDVAILYDHFSPMVLMQLEAYGFCKAGQSPDFVDGEGITVGGGLPINPHGGQLGEAYIHGMNGIAEAVRQARRGAVNQVPDVQHVLVTAGAGVPTSALILGPE